MKLRTRRAKHRLVQNWCNQHGGTTCKISEWAVSKLKTSYAKFSARYGRRGAIAIMAAMAVTMPLPGNILAVIGIAEGVRAVASRFTGNASIEDILDDVRELADELGLPFDEQKFLEAYQRRITENAFCPTGPGGGQDNSCSPHGISAEVTNWEDAISWHNKTEYETGEAVRQYQGIAAEQLNQELRDGRPLSTRSARIDLALSGLYESGEFKAEGEFLRGVSHDTSRLIPGAIYEDKTWSSTTGDFEVARRFATTGGSGGVVGGTPVLLRYVGARGLLVGGPETEVILPKNTSYNVVSRTTQSVRANSWSDDRISIDVVTLRPRTTTNEARHDMPQIRKEHWQDFLTYVRQHTTLTEEPAVDPHDLNAIQSEFSQERVDAIPDEKLKWPILVSKDGYVLDGNHRWIRAGQKGVTIPVLRIGLDRDDALELARSFPKAQYVENWCNQYGGDTCKTGEKATSSKKTIPKKTLKLKPAKVGKQLDKNEIREVESRAEAYIKTLSYAAQDSISHYTDEGFVELNSEMRSCPPTYSCLSRDNKEHLANIERAIDGFPKFREPVLVRRGMSLPRKQAAEFLAKMSGSAGKSFTFPSLISTSMGKSFTGSVRFSITAKHGLPVGNYSENPGENEIILSARSRFRVSRVEGNTVHLEQL